VALTPTALGTCTRALGTGEPSCVGRPPRLFFMLEAHRGPQDTWQDRNSPQPGGEVWSQRTCGSVEAHLSWEARAGTAGHVAVLKPTLAGR
jgi:hypothetical protein